MRFSWCRLRYQINFIRKTDNYIHTAFIVELPKSHSLFRITQFVPWLACFFDNVNTIKVVSFDYFRLFWVFSLLKSNNWVELKKKNDNKRYGKSAVVPRWTVFTIESQNGITSCQKTEFYDWRRILFFKFIPTFSIDFFFKYCTTGVLSFLLLLFLIFFFFDFWFLSNISPRCIISFCSISLCKPFFPNYFHRFFIEQLFP